MLLLGQRFGPHPDMARHSGVCLHYIPCAPVLRRQSNRVAENRWFQKDYCGGFFYSQRQTIDCCINLLSRSPFAIKHSNVGSLTSFRCPPCTDFATYTARLPRSCLNHQGSEWRGLRFMSRGSSKQPFAAFIWQSPLSDFASRFAFPHYHSHPTPQHLKSASN